ncbi:MAG: hypothetical protein IMZ64_00510 [Bacteroidetes bacterium]|nr:hypothetical protein [Bacteroidota bacterium]
MKTENKLIAEFMGLKPVKVFGRYSISKDHCMCNEETEEKAMSGFASIAKYSSSWDWLMPVINKIGLMYHNFGIVYEEGEQHAFINCFKNGMWDRLIVRSIETTVLENTYLVVVDFIEWYNENKTT